VQLTDLKDKTIEQEVGSLSIRKEEEEAASEDEKELLDKPDYTKEEANLCKAIIQRKNWA